MAIYGITVTHNMFSFYRARVALAAELRSTGIPDTSVDNGWEYNFAVELQHAPTSTTAASCTPPHAYIPVRRRLPHLPHVLVRPHPTHPSALRRLLRPQRLLRPRPLRPRPLLPLARLTPGTLYVVRYVSTRTP